MKSTSIELRLIQYKKGNKNYVALPENNLKTTNKKKLTQSAFTCSKPTIETLEQGVEYVQSKQKRDTRTTPNIFHTFL